MNSKGLNHELERQTVDHQVRKCQNLKFFVYIFYYILLISRDYSFTKLLGLFGSKYASGKKWHGNRQEGGKRELRDLQRGHSEPALRVDKKNLFKC